MALPCSQSATAARYRYGSTSVVRRVALLAIQYPAPLSVRDFCEDPSAGVSPRGGVTSRAVESMACVSWPFSLVFLPLSRSPLRPFLFPTSVSPPFRERAAVHTRVSKVCCGVAVFFGCSVVTWGSGVLRVQCSDGTPDALVKVGWIFRHALF